VTLDSLKDEDVESFCSASETDGDVQAPSSIKSDTEEDKCFAAQNSNSSSSETAQNDETPMQSSSLPPR
jgi:hypothetical protein